MRPARALVALLLAAFALVALPACGSGDDQLSQLQQRAEKARDRLEARIERLRERARKVLADLEQAVPQATPETQSPETRGRTEQTQIEGFLTDVLGSVDRYWTRTLTASGRPEPRVVYVWVPPGRTVGTACGAPADENAAFYCPNDDTIYFSEVLAARLWEGVAQNFPGEQAGYGHAVGDFGVAYVVAHEYAHNVQNELGLFRLGQQELGAKPFELQADCMAGLWGNSVYREGKLQPGDVEEALSTATAAGDFDFNNAQHHGTPEERRAAWLTGYQSGDPTVCGRYVPT
jgi:predicted metalloprotease